MAGIRSRSDRLTEVHEHLVTAVEALTTDTDWRRFLDTARRFGSYSINNLLLILAQRPDATRVAGYRTWQSLGRQVRRGERGIAILAPCIYTQDEGDRADDAHEDERPARRLLRGFKVVHVFDISQTDGEPLPEPPVHVLTGDAPACLTDRLAELIRAEGFTFALAALPAAYPGAFGLTEHDQRRVTVRPDLAPAQQAKTTAHELAHVLLHGPAGPRLARSRIEVEAESVAYLVCGAFGLATDAYSFGYVATWGGGDDEVVRAVGERAVACAGHILDALGVEAPADPVA